MTTIDCFGFDVHMKTISFCAKAQDGKMDASSTRAPSPALEATLFSRRC